MGYFYPRHPRGWRQTAAASPFSGMHFYPRHPRGWRHRDDVNVTYQWQVFLSTPPSRVATFCKSGCIRYVSDFYPRHPRGWRRRRMLSALANRCISIHATLAGGDGRHVPRAAVQLYFYPRHPRGWRPASWRPPPRSTPFLSTPPSRVATTVSDKDKVLVEFLSTPPSRVATRLKDLGLTIRERFLSTPPSRVATLWSCARSTAPAYFYPRHPRGWRRRSFIHKVVFQGISIHATLAGGDDTPFEGGVSAYHPVSIHATLAGGDADA